MADVVVIPAYNRPEFLRLTLELITKNRGFQDYLYLFALDYGFKTTLLQEIKTFGKTGVNIEIIRTPYRNYREGKQSYNLLNGYRLAASKSTNLVFLIEDDVFISNIFFEWHKVVHQAEPEIFCSIATRNNNTQIDIPGDVGDYYLKTDDYQSLGVCFKKQQVEFFGQYVTSEYFSNPVEYCRRTFPTSPLNIMFSEQDGLLRRIMGKYGLYNAFSVNGLAYHAGAFSGKNRGRRLEGTLEQKIQQLRDICFDKDKMREAVLSRGLPLGYYLDSEPVSLTVEWNREVKRIEL